MQLLQLLGQPSYSSRDVGKIGASSDADCDRCLTRRFPGDTRLLVQALGDVDKLSQGVGVAGVDRDGLLLDGQRRIDGTDEATWQTRFGICFLSLGRQEQAVARHLRPPWRTWRRRGETFRRGAGDEAEASRD